MAGFALWMYLILSGFGSSGLSENPFERSIAGVPVAVLGFGGFAGGGVLAGIGSGMAKAARKREEQRRRG
jgi:hypothetical protein